MLAVSYYLSTKHYLINYNFRKISFYFILAFALFAISKIITIESKVIYMSINTILLFGFISIAYLIEKKALTHEN